MKDSKPNLVEIKFQKLFDLNHRLHKLINKIADTQAIPENDLNVVSGFFMAKTMKTHMAVIELCREGYGEDARSLIRSLFENMVNFQYLVRFDLADRFLAWDVVVRAQMMTPYKNSKLGKELEEKLEAQGETIDGIIERAKKNQEKYSFKPNNWSQKNLFEMALAIGQDHTYRTVFKIQCQNVHPAPRSMTGYMIRTKDQLYFDPSPSEKDIDHCLVEAFDFTSNILKTFNSISKQLDTKNIVELRLEFENLIQKV